MYFKYFKLSTYNQHHFQALKPGKKTDIISPFPTPRKYSSRRTKRNKITRKKVEASSKEHPGKLPQKEDIDLINFRVSISFTNKH